MTLCITTFTLKLLKYFTSFQKGAYFCIKLICKHQNTLNILDSLDCEFQAGFFLEKKPQNPILLTNVTGAQYWPRLFQTNVVQIY